MSVDWDRLAVPEPRRRVHGSVRAAARLWLPAIVAVVCGPPLHAQPRPVVEISGGADESGHLYEWTVTNRHTSAVLRVEFPHYHADLFLVPDGWNHDASTNLTAEGNRGGAGLGIGEAETVLDGIGRGRSLTFRLRVSPLGANIGTGTARTVFADGTETYVSGVEVPVAAPSLDRFISLIGLGVIFAGWLIVSTVRKRRRGVDTGVPP